MDTQEGTETKKKRTTIADLKRDLQELEQLIDENVLEELVAHTDRLVALENGFLADAPATWGEIDKRLVALENATGALADAVREIAAGTDDWELWRKDAEDLIHSMQAALTDMQESATHTEPVPLPRPVPEQHKHIDPDALKAIAQVAQNMGDVLHMTRVLQAAGGLSDDEKRQIMSIACQAAGVPYSENLLVRAGVRHFEA